MYTLPEGINVIGICGNAGSGKDTLADALTEVFTFTYWYAFADPLKDAASAMFGIPVEHFHDASLKEQLNEYWNTTPRQIAQLLGTEGVRKLFGDDFWIMRLHGNLIGAIAEDDCVGLEPGDTAIISDVRFQNEYDYIIHNGGIVFHLSRPGHTGAVGVPNHASESIHTLSFHTKERTYCLNNDSTIPNLVEKARLAVIHNFPSIEERFNHPFR